MNICTKYGFDILIISGSYGGHRRHTTYDGHRTTPRVWHKLPTGELRARNPATLPLKSPQQAARRPPRLSQGPTVSSRLENPTAKALRAQPSAGRPPTAPGGSVITEPRGARRPPARTHAVGPGMGKSRGGPYVLATPPPSLSRAPSKPHGVRPASVRGPWSRPA